MLQHEFGGQGNVQRVSGALPYFANSVSVSMNADTMILDFGALFQGNEGVALRVALPAVMAGNLVGVLQRVISQEEAKRAEADRSTN